MVSLFSRFSISRNGHRRTQSALGGREEVAPVSEASAVASATVVSTVDGGLTTITAGHGIEVAVEFKPLDHPTEPFDHDVPIQCPLPEPSILNDGRIWKEQVSVGARRRPDTPAIEGGNNLVESEPKPKPPSRRLILPSVSAPEHSILKLLEESGI